jgi:hypothetical protein
MLNGKILFLSLKQAQFDHKCGKDDENAKDGVSSWQYA